MRCECCGPREASSKRPRLLRPAPTAAACPRPARPSTRAVARGARGGADAAQRSRAGAVRGRGRAALSLFSRCAEDAPLLVLIDDAHLLDPASAETIRFVARRLVADPIALLISCGPNPKAIQRGLPMLELSGLDLAAAAALIANRRGDRHPEVVGGCTVPRATHLRYSNCPGISTASPACHPNCQCRYPTPWLRPSGGRVSSGAGPRDAPC